MAIELLNKCASVAAHTVRTSRKDSDDCHEVFCDSFSRVRFLLIEHHELGAKLSQEPLEVFDSKSCEAVTVGNHNRFDSSAQYESQKEKQLRPLEAEPRADVTEAPDVRV